MSCFSHHNTKMLRCTDAGGKKIIHAHTFPQGVKNCISTIRLWQLDKIKLCPPRNDFFYFWSPAPRCRTLCVIFSQTGVDRDSSSCTQTPCNHIANYTLIDWVSKPLCKSVNIYYSWCIQVHHVNSEIYSWTAMNVVQTKRKIFTWIWVQLTAEFFSVSEDFEFCFTPTVLIKLQQIIIHLFLHVLPAEFKSCHLNHVKLYCTGYRGLRKG